MHLQRPSMAQSQKFMMNPQVYQAIKLLELPILDLREKIAEELERNPALEVLLDNSTVSLEAETVSPKEAFDYDDENYFEAAGSGFAKGGGEAASDEQHRFIEGTLSHPETLQEHLLWQVRLGRTDEEVLRLCELLIQNLDDDGFHREPVEVLLKGEAKEKIERALNFVQQLDPVGTCTKDYLESLNVQARFLSDAPSGITEALSYLELLERGKTAEVAKLMGIREKDAANIFLRIKELSPFPGRRFGAAEIRYVIPDIQVLKKEGEFVIILNEEEIPILGINPFFMKVAAGEALPAHGSEKSAEKKPERDFAQENIKEARWFINSVNSRNHTLLRVCRALVEFQRAFFIKGPKFLSPLTLKDIARELKLHETTVSRIARGKYVQTEWGIFEIRHFFTNSISGIGSSTSKFSKEGVKEIIKEIIQGEKARLSDNDIVSLLAKRGIVMARRTVTKYRSELDVRSSFDR
ncbi:MAG: RNA polymerase factor sigma-54 [Treponema sp.]|nr:RNA polymerase factor sigma-54 [Treponema sp.]